MIRVTPPGRLSAAAIQAVSEHVAEIVEGQQRELVSRGFRVANALLSSAAVVLRGRRSGRWYPVPGPVRGGRGARRRRRPAADATGRRAGWYRASAPGESPAVRTGALRASYRPAVSIVGDSPGGYIVRPGIHTTGGTGRYATRLEDTMDRPISRPIVDRALPAIQRIYGGR